VVVLSDARAPNYELAYDDYRKGMKYKEIAEKYGVTLNTVKSWKTRYRWSKDPKKGVHTKAEKVCTQKGGQPGNRNAAGHGGTGPPKNKNAEKHGFYSRWLPAETLEIMEGMPTDPLDILWDQIQIAYTAIIRAQQIMYVRDRDDKSTTRIQHKKGETVKEERWEIQQAWDKHASFMSAQSRQQKTLESLVKQYDELLHKNWELATDEQKARIDQIRAQTDRIKADSNNQEEDGVEIINDAPKETG